MKQVLAQTSHLIDTSVDPRKEMGVNLTGSQVLRMNLVPFTSVHLSSLSHGGMTPGGSWTEVYGFAAIAALILLIASFNFTNLATARALLRAREVSLRKVLGAHRQQLIFQFLSESILSAAIALVAALALSQLLTPTFDVLISRPLYLHYLADWPLLLAIMAVTALTGLLGGAYPAFVLSGFSPAATLRSRGSEHAASGSLRTLLVVLQFAISIALGVTALVVLLQIRYADTVNLGFNRDNVVVIENADTIKPTAQRALVRLLAHEPSIAGAALSGPVPFASDHTLATFQKPGDPQQIFMRSFNIAPGYGELYGMHLIAGRDFSSNRANDVFRHIDTQNYNVVINAIAALRLGYRPQQAIGKTFRSGKHVLTIVGVFSNPRLDGPQVSISPVVFYNDPQSMERISVRLKSGQLSQGLSEIDRAWRQFAPNTAVERRFLSDSFARMFRADAQRGRIFTVFVALAISIACLGLYGLAAFTVRRRAREVSIRKVFGARTRDVVLLLLWQFSAPVLLANLIAWPITWYYLSDWLDSFAARIWLSPAYFAAAGLVALLIAWITVGAHALHAARAKPASALHYE